MEQTTNPYRVLIVGRSTMGKTSSLAGFAQDEGVLYLNCESGKRPPFRKYKMEALSITDPLQLDEAFDYAEDDDNGIHTIIIDTFNYLMDMYETQYVLTAADGRSAWGNYAQYGQKLLQDRIANTGLNVVIMAHTSLEEDAVTGTSVVKVPVKGALGRKTLESFVDIILACKRLTYKQAEKHSNDLLTLSDQEKSDGIKYVYQTRITKETVNETIRSPGGMWDSNELYIDNDIVNVIERVHEYYDEE